MSHDLLVLLNKVSKVSLQTKSKLSVKQQHSKQYTINFLLTLIFVDFKLFSLVSLIYSFSSSFSRFKYFSHITDF